MKFFSTNWVYQPKPVSGQNRPKPVFSVKIDQAHFFRPKLTKTSFFSRSRPNRLFPPKSTKPNFFGQNSIFLAKHHFFWLKLTKTSFFGQNRPKPACSRQSCFVAIWFTQRCGGPAASKEQQATSRPRVGPTSVSPLKQSGQPPNLVGG